MFKLLAVTTNTERVNIWKTLMDSSAYTIDIALSGEEALKRAALGKPDIIFLDQEETTHPVVISHLKNNPLTAHIPCKIISFNEFTSRDALTELITHAFATARILIAEDDRTMSEILKAVLLAKGFSVNTSFDGAQTLRVIQQWRPHLVILDIMLPVIDGFHICQKVNEDALYNPKPKFVIISGRESECGAEAYLVKPFDNGYFIHTVQTVLGTH